MLQTNMATNVHMPFASFTVNILWQEMAQKQKTSYHSLHLYNEHISLSFKCSVKFIRKLICLSLFNIYSSGHGEQITVEFISIGVTYIKMSVSDLIINLIPVV